MEQNSSGGDLMRMKSKKTATTRRKPRRETLEMLSENMKVLRVKRRFSQELLADEAGLQRSYIGDLERCEQNPTLATLEALADAFEVRIADLLMPTSSTPAKRQRGGG